MTSDLSQIQKQARDRLRDQGSRFLDYLAAVAQSEVKPLRMFSAGSETILSSELPDDAAVVVGPSPSRTAWLTVKHITNPEPVFVPGDLRPYLKPRSISSTTSEPSLNDDYEKLKQTLKESLNDRSMGSPGIEALRERIRRIDELFDLWLRKTWKSWVENNSKREQVANLYGKLFDLYTRLDQDSDYVELVFGHCILTWAGRHSVVYPLVLTSAHLVFDESNGTIRVEPVSASRMSLAPVEQTDLPGYAMLEKLRDRFNDDPVDMWDEAERSDFEQRMLHMMGVSARISRTLTLTATEEPVLQSGWTLMLRKRADNRGVFYQSLARKLRESEQLPLAFEAVFADARTLGEAFDESPVDDDADERLLMPLPANDEQMRIVHQLAHSSGVTVQGPPGTGKSHTIVNLISHLLAQGKRILVTAEKEQALAVLKDKIPHEIRDCAVASIGTSSAEHAELRLSVQRLQDSLSDLDITAAKRRTAVLDTRIDVFRERLRDNDQRISEALARENDTYTGPDGVMTAAQVAAWVADHADMTIIPDAIPADVTAPLSSEEFEEFVSLCRNLDEEDIRRSQLPLPDITEFPPAESLSETFAELTELSGQVRQLQTQGLDTAVWDALAAETAVKLVDEVQRIYDSLARFDSGWESSFGSLLRSNDRLSEWMRQSTEQLLEQANRCVELSQLTFGHIVTVPDGEPRTQCELIDLWQNRVHQGKGIPRFLNKELREFAASVTVDGYMPKTEEDLALVRCTVEQRQLFARLTVALRQTFADTPVPLQLTDGESPLYVLDTLRRVLDVIQWWNTTYPHLIRLIKPLFHYTATMDLKDLQQVLQTLRGARARTEQQQLTNKLRQLADRLALNQSDLTGLWSELRTALRHHDVDAWKTAMNEVRRLTGIRDRYGRLCELRSKLATAAPAWAEQIVQTRGNAATAGKDESLSDLWEAAKATTWITHIVETTDVGMLLDESQSIAQDLQEAVNEDIGLSARLHLKISQKPDERRALQVWMDAVKRVGKGTGKNAARYMAAARHALPQAMNAMPVWIMPIHKVLDNFDPARSDRFDVIIVDESSQCDLLSVGVLALADKAIIVGDDRQTTPSSAFRSGKLYAMLQERYIPDFEEKSLYSLDESLYAIANRTFESRIMLREHFRCVPEIIDYSNRFYNGQIFPLRERTHPEIGSPLQARYVPDAQSIQKGTSRINEVEAQAIVDQVTQCCNDPRYEQMTFGVVTLMSGDQQKIITDKLVAAIGTEEFARRHLRVGNPPAFQGDERNVIFLSFVTDASRSNATQESNAQWMNVAASRAQDQLWAFYSMDIDALSPKDYRRGLIDHVRDYEVETPSSDPLGEARTDFERDIVRELLAHGYGVDSVSVHHRVGRYAIDCVVTVAPGYRLAVECDGDDTDTVRDFSADVRKQRILERLGWHFLRLSAPAYYLDREHSMAPVWQYLDRLKEQYVTCQTRTQHKSVLSTELAENDEAVVDEPRYDETTGEPYGSETTDRNQILTSVRDALSALQEQYVEPGTETVPEITVDDAVTETEIPDENKPQSDVVDAAEHALEKDIDEYGFQHAEPLSEQDLPEQGLHEMTAKWVRTMVQLLVDREYPLNKGAAYDCIIPVLSRKGITLASGRQRINDAFDVLTADQTIAVSQDGYYFPEPLDKPFHIIEGRSISRTSVSELAAVMNVIMCRARMMHEELLYRAVQGVYGFHVINSRLRKLLEKAVYQLKQAELITVHNGAISALPSQQEIDTPMEYFRQYAGISLPEDETEDEAEDDDMPATADDMKSAARTSSYADSSSTGFVKTGGQVYDVPDASESADSNSYVSSSLGDYGTRYGLTYAEPVQESDLPLRWDYPDIDTWVQAAVMMIVCMEYPLRYGRLRLKLTHAMLKCGIAGNMIDNVLMRALRALRQDVVKKSDEFLYPADERHNPFRIIRGRELRDISNRELAFVMSRVVVHDPGCSRDDLFSRVCLVYGFDDASRKVQRKLLSSYELMKTSGKVTVMGSR